MSKGEIPDQLPLWGEPPPAQAHSPTSKLAAREIATQVRNQQDKVLAALLRHGGLTDQQISARAFIPENSSRPRRVELVKAGLVRVGGKERTISGRWAAFWVLTQEGYEVATKGR